MLQRRRTVQHLWNRLMAAMLFVMGAALGSASPSETDETRLARAETGKFETGFQSKRLVPKSEIRLEHPSVDEISDQPVSTSDILRPPYDSPTTFLPWAISNSPVRLTSSRIRGGETRAPPSA